MARKKKIAACVRCGRRKNITEHHVFPQRYFGNNGHNPFVLTLCSTCHQDKKFGVERIINQAEREYEERNNLKLNSVLVYGNLEFFVNFYLQIHADFLNISIDDLLLLLQIKGAGNIVKMFLNKGKKKTKITKRELVRAFMYAS